MKLRSRFLVALAASALLLAGCGNKGDQHSGHDHGDHTHGEAASGGGVLTSFKEGVGLSFPEETRRAIGLATVEVEERLLPISVSVTAQVFDSGLPSLATASVPLAQAEALAGKSVTGGRIVRIDRTAASITGEAELILALDSVHAGGDFVTLTLTAETPFPVMAIPRSGLLRTTAGTFAYVANGAAFLRTPVSVGASSADGVEITDGLYTGDIVVARPVEQLWLTELRLTKGGGHAH